MVGVTIADAGEKSVFKTCGPRRYQSDRVRRVEFGARPHDGNAVRFEWSAPRILWSASLGSRDLSGEIRTTRYLRSNSSVHPSCPLR